MGMIDGRELSEKYPVLPRTPVRNASVNRRLIAQTGACPDCKKKDAELARLREENARMMKRFSIYDAEVMRLTSLVGKVQDENARLRPMIEESIVIIRYCKPVNCGCTDENKLCVPCYIKLEYLRKATEALSK